MGRGLDVGQVMQEGMMAWRPRLVHLSYQLNHHYWSDMPLSLAGVLVLGGAALASLLPCAPGRPWLTVALAALTLALAGVALAGRLAGYVQFRPEGAPLSAVTPTPLPPREKIPHRASGTLSVEGKERRQVEIEAWFRSFETREHAVMAYRSAGRFWGGERPADEVGMWYLFFQPGWIRRVEAGHVVFGHSRRPGLRVTFQGEDSKEPSEVLLSFDTQENRTLVLADLLYDAPDGAGAST
ncbi:MAG: hypothetical protein GX605_03280 [Chloroflexi bacterium]|nr:hypothetical protein [Chloroflexota bacterium]